MHTYNASKGTIIHHNGDPEGGKLTLVLPSEMLEESGLVPPVLHRYGGDSAWAVEVSADDMIDFVLEQYIKAGIISKLEQVGLREVFNQWKK